MARLEWGISAALLGGHGNSIVNGHKDNIFSPNPATAAWATRGGDYFLEGDSFGDQKAIYNGYYRGSIMPVTDATAPSIILRNSTALPKNMFARGQSVYVSPYPGVSMKIK